MLGPQSEFTGPTSFKSIYLSDLLDKMRTFSHIWGLRGPTSFENIDLLDLLDKMRTFSLIWGPQREFSGTACFEITVLYDLLDKMRTFLLYGALIVYLLVQILFK